MTVPEDMVEYPRECPGPGLNKGLQFRVEQPCSYPAASIIGKRFVISLKEFVNSIKDGEAPREFEQDPMRLRPGWTCEHCKHEA